MILLLRMMGCLGQPSARCGRLFLCRSKFQFDYNLSHSMQGELPPPLYPCVSFTKSA